MGAVNELRQRVSDMSSRIMTLESQLAASDKKLEELRHRHESEEITGYALASLSQEMSGGGGGGNNVTTTTTVPISAPGGVNPVMPTTFPTATSPVMAASTAASSAAGAVGQLSGMFSGFDDAAYG